MSHADEPWALPAPAEEPTRRPRGHPLLAWLVIVAVVGFIVILPRLRAKELPPGVGQGQAILALQLQARLWAALTEAQFLNREEAYRQAQAFNTGSFSQRIRFVVVAGDLAGPSEAIKQLRALDQSAKEANEPLTPAQEDAYQLLLKLYQVRDAGQAEADLTDEEEARLRERLGWFGDLALAPPDGSHQAARDVALQPAYRTLTGLITFGSVFGVLALIGLFGLPIFLICLATGSARTRLTTGSPASGLYAEAFALYLLLFVGASFAITYLRPPGGDLLWSGAAALLGLTAIAWPVVRGLPWSQVRRDIGINGGRHPVLELLLGLVGYALTLPLLAVGFIITLILLTLQRHLAGEAKPGQGPTHPVNDYLAAGDWQVGLQVLILAAVIAPIVEETLFRGVLHRQLREATGRLGGVLSFLVSAFFGSFLFAVIHPQGFLFVPALMGLALGFALLREWRDSVIPGVIAHGVHNGSLVLFLLVVAS